MKNVDLNVEYEEADAIFKEFEKKLIDAGFEIGRRGSNVRMSQNGLTVEITGTKVLDEEEGKE